MQQSIPTVVMRGGTSKGLYFLKGDLPSVENVLGNKIMLVDDARRKGEHMREAFEFLKMRFPNCQIYRFVLLELKVPHKGAEQKVFRGDPVERSAFSTNSTEVLLPWD